MKVLWVQDKIPYANVSVAQVLLAIFAFTVGYIIVSLFVDLFKRSLKKAKMPKMATEFLAKFTKMLLLILVLLAILPILGINVNSIVLGLSAIIGLILGFGLQDTMTNVFSGLWLALLKPFEIGDYIEVNGFSGTLKSVGIMATTLTTFDNKVITIPNKLIWGAAITNYTKMDQRRLEINVGVSYNTKLDKAISIAMKILKEDNDTLEKPEPEVIITELGDSAINLQLRAWVKTDDYWRIKNKITKEVIENFKKNRIEIPFPQLDVHLKKR